MDNLKVSIIMPVYNAEKYLNRSISSVKNQIYQNWELLIVDDGSVDNSKNICMAEVEKDNRIQLICNEHGGTALARNTAIELASGDYIAFLDADDAFHPQYLQSMVQAVQDTGTQISLSRTVRGTDENEFVSKIFEPSFVVESKEDIYIRMYGGQWPDMIAPYTKIYAKEIFETVRFPKGRYFEDAATMNLAIYHSNYVAITDTPLYFYNITPNSSSVTKKSYELLDREWALRSHWEFFLKEGRKDLVYLSIPFYLIELISIYHRIENSDKPSDKERIRKQFENIYRKYKNCIQLTEEQKNCVLAFRYPKIYDIRNMIKKDGVVKTVKGFIDRKLK